MPRHSRLQLQILSLYRDFLRATRNKPDLSVYVKGEFRKNSAIPKTSVLIIEQLYRRAQRQLKMLQRQDVSSAGIFGKQKKE